jgi:hypothetical protein
LNSNEEDFDDEPTLFEWDEALASKLIGKHVIAGFVYLASDGISIEKRMQVHGVILDADPETGFTLSLKGKRLGETMMLPASTSGFVEASHGRYRLKGTDELVYDPDYTSLWTITARVLH